MADSSSTVESKVSARRHARSRAPKPALAAASRRPETVAAAVARGPVAAAESVSREANPDVLPGFKKAHADPARMALKRKADEGFLHPNNKKAKNEDASSDEEEEYPPKFPDFDWLRLVSFVPPTKLPPLQIENSIFNSPYYSVYLSDFFDECDIVSEL